MLLGAVEMQLVLQMGTMFLGNSFASNYSFQEIYYDDQIGGVLLWLAITMNLIRRERWVFYWFINSVNVKVVSLREVKFAIS